MAYFQRTWQKKSAANVVKSPKYRPC